ncbi:MAG: hypothetical protein JW755_07215 [Candidatus Aminicenantes bacterium]|nr:hypothetical protein [Candidatus Aminicenantes bacterium]
MKTWFYIFAWWSLILIFDSLNFRLKKTSPLFRSPKKFVFMTFISVFVWLIFELFNLSLQNWSYHDLPHSLPIRWTGYFFAFATVLPALVELSELFSKVFKDKNWPGCESVKKKSFLNGSVILGVLSLGWCLLLPKLFFPLVWLGFIFLLEPINYRKNNDSLYSDLEKGQWGQIFSWLAAGFASGILWELLNFWSNSRWEYTLPYLNFGRIFQMPVFGYGGFLPFALEVFALWSLIQYIKKIIDRSLALQIISIILILGLYAWIFHLMDLFTVKW